MTRRSRCSTMATGTYGGSLPVRSRRCWSATRPASARPRRSGSTPHGAWQLIDADRPASPPRAVLPRQRDHIYDIDHLDGRFVIRTNAGAKNFRLVEVPEARVADRSAWRDVIPARPDALVEDFT